MTWALEDWTVDALELSDELKDFAREMAGESAVALTSDRENILLTAALEVELYMCSPWAEFSRPRSRGSWNVRSR